MKSSDLVEHDLIIGNEDAFGSNKTRMWKVTLGEILLTDRDSAGNWIFSCDLA